MAKREIEKDILLREEWYVLKVDSELSIGEYDDANATAEAGIEDHPYSIRLKSLGATACEYTGDQGQADKYRNDMGRLIRQSSWRFREGKNQLCVGDFLLSQGADAKQVLDDVYSRCKDRYPSQPHGWIGTGRLALLKNDYALAADNFAKAVQLDGTDPDTHYGLARAYRSSLPNKAEASLKAALAINENHVPSLLMLVEQQVAAESYNEARKSLNRILSVNPHQPEGWAFKAVLAHLEAKPKREAEARERALKFWQNNPEVDHLMGRELSKKYRFQEGSRYQRQALAFSAEYLPAKMQLAHDLLRLGQELEGWKLAEEVFDADQYNVVANNLVALRDNLSQFATLEQNGFVVRMDRAEADCYGHLVFELLEEASHKLSTKYDVELQKPIFIEIFPRQEDFAIRTFGLPGGAGYLGVCFGRVVTMNSPVAQGKAQTNWRSVLWHEFCHVVTLQKTKNKMPRWLSEGISVYEERLANPAWGDSMDPGHRMMVLGGESTPISRLSSAFLNPKSSQHLQFAYYESSMVVEYLVEKFGQPAMASLLADLGRGTAINDALQRHMAPTEFLDTDFEKYLTSIARNLAPDADWTPLKEPPGGISGWQNWLKKHPKNYYGLLALSGELVKAGQYDSAIQSLDELDSLYGDANGAEQSYRLRAAAHRGLSQLSMETAALEKAIQRDASDLESCSRLMDIYSTAARWDELKRVCNRMQGINPMLKSSHHRMATAAEKTRDDNLLIRELKVLVSLKPLDRADIHYRLGAAQMRQGKTNEARRNALMALEVAPRYRDAHKLLLTAIGADDANGDKKASTKTVLERTDNE